MSTYKPHTQGRKDARQGKPRYQHASRWNQEQYDRAYDEEMAQQDREEARRPEPRLTELEEQMLEALQAVLSVADRQTYEFDLARAAIAKATGGQL
jgi:hypothetical protein